jgi:Sulfatase
MVGGAVACLILLGLIGRFRPENQSSPARDPGLNILLVTIDTLRADALGAYGQPGGVMPWMDRLASAGARFSNAHAHNVITLPAHANILSTSWPDNATARGRTGIGRSH